eukprot:scaffold766_cov179-Amphora_coffeaeformis.AAC.21
MTTTLERGTLVVIDGLESEIGKPLNGGHGILLGGATETSGVWRYPVRIFATQKAEDEEGDHQYNILETVQNKTLKAANVAPWPCAEPNRVFQEAMEHHVSTMMQTPLQRKEDEKFLLFWLWAAYHVIPHHYRYGISYANALRDMEQKPKEAADIMNNLFEMHKDKLRQDPFYPRFCREAVFSFCDAREYLDKAVEYAMDIPLKEGEHLATATEALSKFGDTCIGIIQEQRGLQVHEIARLNLQARKALCEIDPMNSLYTEKLAGAHCLAGDNWEGVKLYRRASKNGVEMDDIRSNLILAQLQCPGMPLEDYHGLGQKLDKVLCVHKNDLDKLRIDKETGNVISMHPDGLEMIEYDLPSDPDDPELFASLLVMLNVVD